jgi:pyridoxine kinase
MPSILSLSSQVAYGHVGHSAAVFAWQRLGLEVMALPTILLSNRPGYAHRADLHVPPATLGEMLEALAANDFLAGLDAVFTGYLPTDAHVTLAADWVSRLKASKSDLLYCCDPIIGDDPRGLYVGDDVACAIRAKLVPLADLITPNRFELAWLAGADAASPLRAVAAARGLAPMVLATSVPEGENGLTNVLVGNGHAWQTTVARRGQVAHGTGDLMAALFLAHYLRLRLLPDALALATGALEEVISASEGSQELRLVESQERWVAPRPWLVSGIVS